MRRLTPASPSSKRRSTLPSDEIKSTNEKGRGLFRSEGAAVFSVCGVILSGTRPAWGSVQSESLFELVDLSPARNYHTDWREVRLVWHWACKAPHRRRASASIDQGLPHRSSIAATHVVIYTTKPLIGDAQTRQSTRITTQIIHRRNSCGNPHDKAPHRRRTSASIDQGLPHRSATAATHVVIHTAKPLIGDAQARQSKPQYLQNRSIR